MKKTPYLPLWLLLLLAAAFIAADQLTAADRLSVAPTDEVRLGGEARRFLYADQNRAAQPMQIAAPAALTQTGTAVFEVNFIGPWPTQAQDAFNYALQIWSSQINSTVPIVVEAEWESMHPSVLGGANPTTIHANFPNVPMANTWYVAAVANALSGNDLNGSSNVEIETSLNSAFPYWYFGVDGQPPSNQYDFVTVVLHEIGHGLGFYGSMDVKSGIGQWGYTYSYYPMIYDRFTYNGQGQALLNTSLFPNPSLLLGQQLTSNNLYFIGNRALAANNNNWVKLYAPSPWRSGSSHSHLDNIFNNTPHALMTYSQSNGEALHDPGPLTLAILHDLGWPEQINSAPTISGLPNQALPAGSSLNQAIDLWSYASDAESAVNELTFTLDNSPAPGAGVTLTNNRYVNINPLPTWMGETTARIRVTDPGGLSDTAQFTVVAFNTPPVLNPLPLLLTAVTEPAHPMIDLWQYAFDYQTPTDQLQFEIVSVTEAAANATIIDNRYLTVDPEPEWVGEATAVVRVTDNSHEISPEQPLQIFVAAQLLRIYAPMLQR